MKANWRVGVVVACAALGAGGLQASSLWDAGVAGAVQGNNKCDYVAVGNQCGLSSGQAFTIFDNFQITDPRGWIVRGFDFVDFFNGVGKSVYSTTNWSIWLDNAPGNPGTNLTLVANGTKAASLIDMSPVTCGVQSNCTVDFQVRGLSVTLAAGTYFLATNNVLTSGETFRYIGLGGTDTNKLLGWQQVQTNNTGTSIVAVNSFSGNNTAFSIEAEIAPEPGTWALMLISVAGLGLLRRRRTT